jgi:hypothetical protein
MLLYKEDQGMSISITRRKLSTLATSTKPLYPNFSQKLLDKNRNKKQAAKLQVACFLSILYKSITLCRKLGIGLTGSLLSTITFQVTYVMALLPIG